MSARGIEKREKSREQERGRAREVESKGKSEAQQVRVFKRCCCLLLQYLIQSCARGGRRIVEDMCYEIRRAEACVD